MPRFILIFALLTQLSTAASAQTQEMAPLDHTIYQAISLGRSSAKNYPAHVAIIDARSNPISVIFPNLECSGVLVNKHFPDKDRFKRWPALRDYKGISQFDLKITKGICLLGGHVVLHHGIGGNCLFGCRDLRMTYFYFGADGSASGAEMTPNPEGLTMTADDATDIIDLARVR